MDKDLDYEEHASWPEAIESYFIGLLHEEAKKGLPTLDKKGWKRLENEVFDKFGKRYKVDQLKSKFNRLRKAHREFSQLLEQTGIRWDSSTNIVIASDEVWNSHLKKHPNAKRYRKKGLPHYELLVDIFNNTTATGGISYSSTQVPPSAAKEYEQRRHFVSHTADYSCEENSEEVTRVHRRASSVPLDVVPLDVVKPREKKRKRNDDSATFDHFKEEFAKSINAKTEVLLVRIEAIREYIESKEKRNNERNGHVSDPFDVTECQDVLDAMQELDDKLYCKALERFIAVPEWRKVFLRMSEQRRRAWLNSL